MLIKIIKVAIVITKNSKKKNNANLILLAL